MCEWSQTLLLVCAPTSYAESTQPKLQHFGLVPFQIHAQVYNTSCVLRACVRVKYACEIVCVCVCVCTHAGNMIQAAVS